MQSSLNQPKVASLAELYSFRSARSIMMVPSSLHVNGSGLHEAHSRGMKDLVNLLGDDEILREIGATLFHFGRSWDRVWFSRKFPHVGIMFTKPAMVDNKPGNLCTLATSTKPTLPGYMSKTCPVTIRKAWHDLFRLSTQYTTVWAPADLGCEDGHMSISAAQALIPNPIPDNIRFYTLP